MEHVNALPAGTRLGEYEVVEVLGAGGFGITYRAWDTTLQKDVAIKEYLPRDFATRTHTRTVVPTSQADRADYEWGLSRFLDEARTLARFDHPHINKVHRFFEAHGTAYLVLEYIEGETLGALLGRQGRLDEAQVEGLLTDVLSGLGAVHAAGFVHRDIKPGNLMVKPDGSVVVLDFGAARQAVGQRSKRITSILTPGYAPIEQYDTKAEDVGPWSDMYALGMVTYRCISGLGDGELPDAVTRSRAGRKGSRDLEPAASLGQGHYDARLLRAIDWAIRVNEDERPQSIAEWQQALPGLTQSASRATPAGPPRTPQTETTPAPASRWALVGGVVALMVAVAGGAYVYFQPEGVRFGQSGEVATGPEVVPRPVAPPAQQASPSVPDADQSASARPDPPESPEELSDPSPAEVEAGLELTREARRLVQQGLWEAGQEPGPVDGLFGGVETRTRQAIQAWQAAKSMEASGYLTREQAEALIELGRARADDAAYAEAEQADTVEGYGGYLQGYPSGRLGSAARARQAERADDAAYAEAERTHTADGYGAYVHAYPAGRHVQAARASQQRLQAEALGIFMVSVQGGTFTMGCTSEQGDDCHDTEKPAHRVQVRDFEISKYEVTEELWVAVMGENPSRFTVCGQCPVVSVSWEDIQEFLGKLNAGGGGYRLPTEAEWEYAARGGQQSRGYKYAGGNNPSSVANSGNKTRLVGQKQANELGLYDMSGNVWEWVQDCWHESYRGAPRDGRAWESGECGHRVQRGGEFLEADATSEADAFFTNMLRHSRARDPSYLRSADRGRATPGGRDSYGGFRIARTPS